MHAEVLGLRSWLTVALALCMACGDGDNSGGAVDVPAGADVLDAAVENRPAVHMPADDCVDVKTDAATLVEHVRDFTATFRIGASYDRTLMLFGGDSVQQPNALSRAYVFGLDKIDAQVLAKKYPDFYLCSSPGGREASSYIRTYDLVPATCEIYQQLVAALRQYNANVAVGGDRTSVRLAGAPLELTSVVDEHSGADVSDQVSGQEFHLVTSVTQLSGESVLSFGTTE